MRYGAPGRPGTGRPGTTPSLRTPSLRWFRWIGFALLVAASLIHWVRESGRNYAAPDFEPQHIAALMAGWRTRCSFPFACPVSPPLYADVQGASTGNHDRELSLALDLLEGREGAPKNERVGALWLARAAEGGVADAQETIARRRRGGLAVDTDDDKIAAALQAQASRGAPAAIRALAQMYIRGRGVPRDPAEGLRLLRAAAETGDDLSAESLIDIYGSGAPGIPLDRNAEVRWAAFLAAKGRVDMMVLCGTLMIDPSPALLLAGRPGTPGLMPDFNAPEGYRWLMQAALMNDAGGQAELAKLFAEGVSVDGRAVIAADPVAADMWLRLAAHDPAYANAAGRASLEDRMTSAEITAARTRAAAFRPMAFADVMAEQIELPH